MGSRGIIFWGWVAVVVLLATAPRAGAYDGHLHFTSACELKAANALADCEMWMAGEYGLASREMPRPACPIIACTEGVPNARLDQITIKKEFSNE